MWLKHAQASITMCYLVFWCANIKLSNVFLTWGKKRIGHNTFATFKTSPNRVYMWRSEFIVTALRYAENPLRAIHSLILFYVCAIIFALNLYQASQMCATQIWQAANFILISALVISWYMVFSLQRPANLDFSAHSSSELEGSVVFLWASVTCSI